MRRSLKPDLTRPPDFERFWKRTVAELRAIDPEVEVQPVSAAHRGDVRLDHVTFRSLGGVRIGGYALRHGDDKNRPLVVHGHGYGGPCEVAWSWAEAGLNVFGVDVRGYGRSRSACPNPSPWGYALTGIDSPESYVLRGAVCDYIRAVEVAAALPSLPPETLVAYGFSFAGGLAVMAEAVAPRADYLVAGVPTFGWMAGRYFFVRGGSGAEMNAFLEAHPERRADTMLVLRYFDTMNFADLVRCPTMVGIGLSDDVVPAKTVYAVANHMVCPKEVLTFPCSHTDRPEEAEWEKFERHWMNKIRAEDA